MNEREMRKTVKIPNLTMMEMNRCWPLCSTAQEGYDTVPVMESTEPEPSRDAIDPDYYKAGGIEVIQIIEAFGLDYHRASALKYLLRAGRKDDELQDMKKCLWFVNRSVQRLEQK